MRLESARAELRTRSHFEAADLGVLLLRSEPRALCKAWLGLVLPLQLAVFFGGKALVSGVFAGTLAFWLKPLYARPFALILGRGMFGGALTYRGLLRALWTDGRRGLLGDLTVRRLSPTRALVAPVSLLEGLRGAAARRRRFILARDVRTSAWLLVIACQSIELAGTLGLLLGMRMLMPDEFDPFGGDLQGDAFMNACAVAYALASGVAEALFTAASFGLYVNRRTELEGWDVELTFRRMARRLAALVTCLAALCALCLPALAQEPVDVSESALSEDARLPAPPVDESDDAERALERVLARPELAREHVEERWELRSLGKPDPERPPAPWMLALADILARSFVYLAWGAAACVAALLVYALITRVQGARWRPARAPAEAAKGAVVSTLPERAEGLSTDQVAPRVRALLARGELTGALSILYVGTLRALGEQDGIALARTATEGECLRAVTSAAIAPERRSLFVELTAHWQRAAYAHELPGVDALSSLCARFSQCFEAAP